MWHAPLLLASIPLCLTGGERVAFPTEDGLQIVADFYAVDGDAPTVICLPMFGRSRTTFEPLAAALNDAGIQMLALDLRGHGESAPEVAEQIEGRKLDPFLEMHRDVAAAVEFLASRGADTSRISLIGGSIGCSVSVDCIVRDPSAFRSLVLLTPGSNYLGMDTLEHLKSWPGTPCLIFSGGDETSVSEPVAKAMGAGAEGTAQFVVLPENDVHGTQMFGKIDGIEERIARFYEDTLLRPDLRIPHFPENDPRANTAGFVSQTLRLSRTTPAVEADQGDEFTLMAFAVGQTLTLGAMVHQEFDGDVRWELGETVLSFPWDTSSEGSVPVRVGSGRALELEPLGQRGSFRGIHWVNVELPVSLMNEDGTPLRLQFAPSQRSVVDLPGGTDPFSARFSNR